MKSIVDRLIEVIEDPNEVWSSDWHCITNGKIRIWIANIPILDTNTYPERLAIGLYDKWRIWKALQTARANSVARLLNNNAIKPINEAHKALWHVEETIVQDGPAPKEGHQNRWN